MKSKEAQPAIGKKKSSFQYTLKQYWKYRGLFMIMIPSVIMLIIFKYVPIYGIQIAFKNFRLKAGIWGSPWVGLDVFRKVFGMPIFWQAFQNTLILGVMNLVIGFPMPV